MKPAFVFIISVMIFSLYFLPPIVIIGFNQPKEWAFFYIPVLFVNMAWGQFLYDKFDKLFN